MKAYRTTRCEYVCGMEKEQGKGTEIKNAKELKFFQENLFVL